METTARRLWVSSLLVAGLACHPSGRAASRPGDAGRLVTVYVPPRLADRVLERLQFVAAQHRWAISLRTDSEALGEADLVIVDSVGLLLGRPRAGSAAAAEAGTLAAALHR